MDPNDLLRELAKVQDTLTIVDRHFHHEAQMNAALHMSTTVREAPLAAAVGTALNTLGRLITALEAQR